MRVHYATLTPTLSLYLSEEKGVLDHVAPVQGEHQGEAAIAMPSGDRS